LHYSKHLNHEGHEEAGRKNKKKEFRRYESRRNA
jgi:hypothetical protein